MADEVLSQAQIDALIAQNASATGPEISPEVESLLTKASSEPTSEKMFGTRLARILPPANQTPEPEAAAAKPPARAVPRPAAPLQSESARAAVPAPAAPAATRASPAAMAAGAADMEQVLRPLKSTAESLERRMKQAEAAIEQSLSNPDSKAAPNSGKESARMQQLEREIASLKQTVHSLSQNLQTVVNRINSEHFHTAGIAQRLQNTPGYDLRQSFDCPECGSHGNVAILVQCTDCGEEEWWGWSPEELEFDPGEW